jgi:hypothetical protein
MRTLSTLAYWEGLILFGGLFGVVLWKLFTGAIPLNGLLEGDVRDHNSFDGSGFSSSPSAGRSQSLIVTLFVALWYLLQVIHNPREFPKLSDAMIGAMAGSQAVYLGGKAQALFLGRLRDLFK